MHAVCESDQSAWFCQPFLLTEVEHAHSHGGSLGPRYTTVQLAAGHRTCNAQLAAGHLQLLLVAVMLSCMPP